MTENIVKTIEYKDKQLLVTLDFWGTKVLLKFVLSEQIIAAIINENGIDGINEIVRKNSQFDTQYQRSSADKPNPPVPEPPTPSVETKPSKYGY